MSLRKSEKLISTLNEFYESSNIQKTELFDIFTNIVELNKFMLSLLDNKKTIKFVYNEFVLDNSNSSPKKRSPSPRSRAGAGARSRSPSPRRVSTSKLLKEWPKGNPFEEFTENIIPEIFNIIKDDDELYSYIKRVIYKFYVSYNIPYDKILIYSDENVYCKYRPMDVKSKKIMHVGKVEVETIKYYYVSFVARIDIEGKYIDNDDQSNYTDDDNTRQILKDDVGIIDEENYIMRLKELASLEKSRPKPLSTREFKQTQERIKDTIHELKKEYKKNGIISKNINKNIDVYARKFDRYIKKSSDKFELLSESISAASFSNKYNRFGNFQYINMDLIDRLKKFYKIIFDWEEISNNIELKDSEKSLVLYRALTLPKTEYNVGDSITHMFPFSTSFSYDFVVDNWLKNEAGSCILLIRVDLDYPMCILSNPNDKKGNYLNQSQMEVLLPPSESRIVKKYNFGLINVYEVVLNFIKIDYVLDTLNYYIQ
jgi:hypothetical protein